MCMLHITQVTTLLLLIYSMFHIMFFPPVFSNMQLIILLIDLFCLKTACKDGRAMVCSNLQAKRSMNQKTGQVGFQCSNNVKPQAG